MSEIITDKLTGKTSAGDVDVTSEGGAVTMQLQQGLAKAWVYGVGTGTIAIQDSFNIASISDSGTGEYGNNFTSSMNSASYPVHFEGHNSIRPACIDSNETQTSSSCFGNYYAKESARDAEFFCSSIHGDLA